ncbi:hypothetical protein BCEN4_740107 [Burkholderia cenocepacia]|nr:hypothetical protein BCEN4_740107 [Burkholderia cenocepacia]
MCFSHCLTNIRSAFFHFQYFHYARTLKLVCFL